ncbi:hypothetical protein ACFX5E_11455 [Flavobacterium sp. LS2P90]|uniref:Uncharacterized protein n=1 Tax=Flavobacterium xylosi TaxID=3230415 RepID=A0ABW6HXF2_9FLAO
MVTIAQIYDWFMTGKKPTQAQFWASWGSFWNKLEQIPQSAIAGLTAVLNAKAEKAQFDAHKTDAAAHAGLFDTKEDKTQKGVAGGYVPLNEFAKIASEYLNIVNDLVTGGATSLASAETVKTLKTQIDAINTLLTSNDVNLDTVQEIVNAIKTVETSLSTILINDLTTGGTTKAATAETVKVLKGLFDALTTVVGNKVDKVAGERLINAAEITKLAGLGSISTTVKPILSTALTTQNVAGFVTYINALNPVLVVGASEIVKYNLTDTGRVFELNLRGRSFGTGQPAIVAANVLEITEFLNKDIRLSNYPSTRNDGQLPTNKVLSTDALGNLKMYTIATAPAPYLEVLVPDSTQPSTTTNFTLKGAFFTPTMTVAIAGQTINYITFKSDNLVLVNVTTGAIEGSYAVTLNNGIQSVFNNALLIVLGTVYQPTSADWTDIVSNPDFTRTGEAVLTNYNVPQGAKWNKLIDYTKKLSIRFNVQRTPLGAFSIGDRYNILELVNASGVKIYGFQFQLEGGGNNKIYIETPNQGLLIPLESNIGGLTYLERLSNMENYNCEFKWSNGVLQFFVSGVLKSNLTSTLTENLYLKVSIKYSNIINLKYIELV